MKIKSLHGTICINGARNDEKTQPFGAFQVQCNNHQIDHYGPGSIVEIADDEAKRLIERKVAVAVSDDTLSKPASTEEYLNTPEVVMLKDGSRLEKDSEGRWRSVGHPTGG